MLRQYGTRCQPRQYVKVDTHAGPPASLMQDRQLPLQHVQARRLPTLQCAGACSTARNSKAHGQVPLRARAAARRRTDSAGRVQRALWCVSRAWPTTPPERAPRKTLLGHLPKKNKPTTTQAIATYATNEPQYATRSLLSRSRVDWAIEAARRVGAEPVGALGEAGGPPRPSRQVLLPTDASSQRPASSEGDRRAEDPKRQPPPGLSKHAPRRVRLCALFLFALVLVLAPVLAAWFVEVPPPPPSRLQHPGRSARPACD